MSNRAKVLHVDDDPSVTELTNQLLDPEGDRFELTNASDGEAGLQLLEDGEFDCIVSDSVTLSDGRLFASAVREKEASIPLVLFSGKSSDELAAEVRMTGANGYVRKSDTESFAHLRRAIDESLMLADDDWELLAHHDWTGPQELVTTIAAALESYDGVAATEGTPLFDVVDTEALAQLLAPAADGSHRESVSARFTYRNHVFALFGDGRILVRPR
ncbi:HalOD1 output domain-containing protein [Haloprofundus salilacus]|uniref:HalOD1 output domain-containing protein n=1 Tax=Haloprofundus salilacus TaxID=2876190 RepID=UPI001CCC0EC6|nr:HalOD1 output domain-containing protein [Haloprofundus salilacus]